MSEASSSAAAADDASITTDPAHAEAPPPTREAVAAALPVVQSGARWFWWIAVLSLVNTVLHQSGSSTNFVVGLGITIMADAFFESMKAIGFAFDALVLGFFFLMGWLGRQGKVWPFFVGAAVYVGDALIYLYFEDWMPLAFHAFALFFIVKGGWVLRDVLGKLSLR